MASDENHVNKPITIGEFLGWHLEFGDVFDLVSNITNNIHDQSTNVMRITELW